MLYLPPLLPPDSPLLAQPKPGRPPLLTPELEAEICRHIRERGHTDTHAAALAGVSSSSVSLWRKEDEDFALQLDRSRALFIDERLAAIAQACKRDGTLDWRAQMWLLQYACPEVYGPPSRRHRVTGSKEKTEAPEEQAGITPEQLSRLQQTHRYRVEKLNGMPEDEARWVAHHMFEKEPPAFPGKGRQEEEQEQDDHVLPVPLVLSVLERSPEDEKEIADSKDGEPAGATEATNLPKTPALAALPRARPLSRRAAARAARRERRAASPRILQPLPAAPTNPLNLSKPSQNSASSATQPLAAVAAEAAEWRHLHTLLDTQWARSASASRAAVEDPTLGSIPGMWTGS